MHCNIEVLMYKKKFFRCKKKTKWLRYSCLKLALRVCAGQCSSPCDCLISTNEIFFIKIKYFVQHKPKFFKKKNEKLRTFKKKYVSFSFKQIVKNNIYYNNFNIFLGLCSVRYIHKYLYKISS